jgi:hypothetical protein
MRSLTEHKTTVAMLAIVATALALRFYGLSFGLPYFSNFYVRPDESLIVVPAIRLVETSGNPGFFAYPALLTEICAALDQAYFFAARALGWSQSPDIVADFSRNTLPYFVIARAISALAGTFTVLFVFGITRRICSQSAAVVAALLYAVAPLAVRDAHFGVTDSLLTFLLTGTVYMTVRYLEAEQERERSVIFGTAALFGLAISTKYPAFMLLPVLLWAVVWKNFRVMPQSRGPWDKLQLVSGGIGKASGQAESLSYPGAQAVAPETEALHFRKPAGRALGQAAVLLGVALGLFAVLNPYVLALGREFVGNLRGILTIFYRPQPRVASGSLAGTAVLLWTVLRHGPGEFVGLLFSVVGIGWLRKDGSWRAKTVFVALALLSFLLPLLLFRNIMPYRYALPTLPLLAVFAAKGVFDLGGLLGRGALALVLVGCVMAGPGLWKSARIDYLLAQEDTRTQAWRWIEQNVPREVPIVLLGGPESEPQILETAASIERRMGYVKRRYGESSGDLISELYRAQLRDLEARSQRGYEVFRNPGPVKVEGGVILLVLPSHPLRMTQYDPAARRLYSGKVLREVSFTSLSGDWADFEVDSVDAFFVPFRALDRVRRPGPNIQLLLLAVTP